MAFLVLCISHQLSRAGEIGVGLNHLAPLFKLNQNNRETISPGYGQLTQYQAWWRVQIERFLYATLSYHMMSQFDNDNNSQLSLGWYKLSCIDEYTDECHHEYNNVNLEALIYFP